MIDKRGTLQTVIAIIALAAFGVAASEEIDREAEVRVAVNTFGRAFLEADVPTLSSLLTEDYVHVNGGSGNVLNREEWLNWMTSRRTEMDSGKLVIDVYRVEDIEIVLDGNTAIVFGLVKSSQTRMVPQERRK